MPIETSARVAFLKKIHLFQGLEEDELQAIAEQLTEANYAAGAVIFEQNSKAESFCLIYGGSVRITRRQDGKPIQIAVFVKNDYFGEMALVSKRPRSATATAVTDTSLLVLSRKDFEQLYKRIPELRLNLDVAIHSRQLDRRLRFKWLGPDEVIYFLARKHSIVLFQNLVWPVLALCVPIFFFYGWYALARFWIVMAAAIGSLLAIIAWIVWIWIDWGNDYYIVTNQRAIWLEKVVGIYDSRQESPLSTVVAVGVDANPIGRVLDYGDVVIRTYVGKIPFDNVDHPKQAARMIEEHWRRTREAAVETEKEAMKDALRRKLNLLPPSKPKTDSKPPPPAPKKRERPDLLRLLGASTLKLRYETGDRVVYRKHWIALILQAIIPVLGILAVFILFISRLIQLAYSPNEVFISFQGGVIVDIWALVYFLAFFPFLGWFIYEVVDWSNDKYEVTPEQIIDLDKKPLGTESRNAAQLDNILAIEYKRIGLLGNIFNFGSVHITVGGTKLIFENVMDPASVQSDIDRRREARIERKEQAAAAAERERMANWLATYHENSRVFREEEEKKRNQNSG
ncbi:MAG TPA: cyclic nucleotide-binding domain-containing protein [Anaerolineales bacterium]|nr:cyclic nucleotide-binding domain-containing protein [Anaerolineales bacterium]